MDEVKTEDDFDAKYTLSDVSSEEFDECQRGMLETYGNDLKKVLALADTTNRVWTMVDCDDGMYLIAGYHLVNRIYYVITEEEWEDEGEEYLFDSYEGDDYDDEDFELDD